MPGARRQVTLTLRRAREDGADGLFAKRGLAVLATPQALRAVLVTQLGATEAQYRAVLGL